MKGTRIKNSICLFLFFLTLCLPAGCAQSKAMDALRESAPTGTPSFDPASLRMPEATGVRVLEKNGAYMDASNASQGYLMARFEKSDIPHKIGISTAEATYYYTLPEDGSFIVCPLQMGDGAYTVQVYEHVSGTKYSPLCKWPLDVALDDAKLPYLYPNQFVNYDAASAAVRVSFTQSAGAKNDRTKAEQLYAYVARAIDYDYDKAATVQDGYLPAPDRTLEEKKGICFDYAALLATMLRVQNIPARLQMGQLSPDNVYHAWNLVCIENEWYLLDATMYGQGYQDEDYTASKNY